MFKHEIKEQRQVVEKKDYYTAEIEGYDVVFKQDASGSELSIYPMSGSGQRASLGIITCRPRSVAALDSFAETAPKLFRAIAEGLRAEGKDDLRSDLDKSVEDLLEDQRQRVSE